MSIFFIAIVINVVLRYISRRVMEAYIGMHLTNDELNKSFIFNVACVIYLINTVMLYVNVTVIAALFLKQFL